MRIHTYHGQYLTTHGDELRGPRLFPGIVVAPLLAGIAILVAWAMIHAARAPELPVSKAVIGVGVVAVALMALGGFRSVRRAR
jgi:CDP-diglyceride synthetase